jgi:hypothetical protein
MPKEKTTTRKTKASKADSGKKKKGECSMTSAPELAASC